MRYAVTGAGGFIGQALVRELIQDGHEVVAIDLLNPGFSAGVQFKAADITKSGDLVALMEGCDVVFHLAGRLPTAPPDQIRLTNVEGTRKIAEAATKAGLRGLVYTSSIGVYGDTGGKWVTEDAPLTPHTHYGRSKVAAEGILKAETTELSTTILRPGFIYGPNCPILQGFVRKRPFIVGPSQSFGCYVHLADVVAGLKLAASRLGGFQVYNIVDDDPLRAREFVELVAEASGRGPPGYVPVLPVRIALPILEYISTYRGGGYRLTTDFLKTYLTNIRVDTRRIKEALDWRPRFPSSREGLRECFGAKG